MTAIKVEHTHKVEIEFLLETVLACSCFSSWTAYHGALWQHGTYNSVGYPVAYWEGKCWQVFWADSENAEPFDPYRSLDDAWKLKTESPMGERGLIQYLLIEKHPVWADYEQEEFCRVICEAVLQAFDYYGEEKA